MADITIVRSGRRSAKKIRISTNPFAEPNEPEREYRKRCNLINREWQKEIAWYGKNELETDSNREKNNWHRRKDD